MRFMPARRLDSLLDIDSGQIDVQDGALSKVNPLFPTKFAGIVEAKQAGYNGRALIDTDKNNFAPRIGAAWRPFGNKTVFRAGFGIFYDIVPTAVNMAGRPLSLYVTAHTNTASPHRV